MDYGTFDVIFENEKACEVKIEEAGLKTQFSCFSPDVCGDVLRLAAVTQGRYEVIGVMMPAKAGGLELRKSFTRSELKSKALDTAEGYVLIRQGETYTSPEITENRGEEEPQPVSGEPENLPEEWRACRNPGELFSDMQLKGALAGISDALRRDDGDDTFVAVPVREDRPFPDLPVFYYGDEEKIGGREYLVFHVCGGELKI